MRARRERERRLAILRSRAYSAIGKWVESGVKMIHASPGESASMAVLSVVKEGE